MTNRTADISLRKAALVAGFGYVIIFVLGFFAFALENLVVSGDAAATANKIAASESRFLAGIASSLIVLVADLVVGWALYVYLKPVSKSISLLTAWFRLIYVAVALSAFVGLFSLSKILTGATAVELGQLDTLTALSLTLYQYGFNVGFVFFGLHILGLGYLILKSDYVPRVLGVLLIIAALGYQIDSFASLLSSSYANNDTLFVVFVAVPAIVSELALALWLLTRGVNVTPTGKPSTDSG